MNNLNRHPLLRVLFCFTAGILIAVVVPAPLPGGRTWAWIVPLPALWSALSIRWSGSRYARRWANGLALPLAFVAYGWVLTCLHTLPAWPGSTMQHEAPAYVAVLQHRPAHSGKRDYATADVVAVRHSGTWNNTEGRIRLVFSGDSTAAALAAGDLVVFAGTPEAVPPPRNPGQADFRAILHRMQVDRQVTLQAGTWMRLTGGYRYRLAARAEAASGRLKQLLQRSGMHGQELAVLSALLFGDRSGIDPEVRSAFAAAGVMHVLAVSGLHVGIVCMALSFALSFLDRRKNGRLWKLCVIAVFLAAYAVLTGLSPSVLRAAAMFLFLLAGQALERQSGTLNTLAASALIFLAADPHVLLVMGFQLSYVAVAGIVLMQPLLYDPQQTKNRLLRFVFSLAAVSVAAQAATAPLSLFYFHRFPVYFLPANLIVIPLVTVLVYGGIALLAVSPLPVLATPVAAVLQQLAHGLLQGISAAEALPGANGGEWRLPGYEVVFLYVLLGAVLLSLVRKHVRPMAMAMVVIAAWLGTTIVRESAVNRQTEAVVFSVPGRTLIGFTEGRSLRVLADTLDASSGIVLNNYRRERGIRTVREMRQPEHTGRLYRSGPVVQFGNIHMLLVDSTFLIGNGARFPAVDVLVIRQRISVNPETLLRGCRPRRLILDSSVPVNAERKWLQAARRLGVPATVVRREGAWIADLQGG